MHGFKRQEPNRFWNESEDRKYQKFYMTLCLYISAASDFAVGLDLKDKNQAKLNWSTTASYYSIIHSARMICFAAVGDYPTSHALISRFFGEKSCDEKKPEIFVFKTNWLKPFTNNSCQGAKFTFNDLVEYSEQELKLPKSKEAMQAIGKILDNAQKLRNNSNYDALLMAHEYHHTSVTKGFKILSNIETLRINVESAKIDYLY